LAAKRKERYTAHQPLITPLKDHPRDSDSSVG
jgi:hypothetical protein